MNNDIELQESATGLEALLDQSNGWDKRLPEYWYDKLGTAWYIALKEADPDGLQIPDMDHLRIMYQESTCYPHGGAIYSSFKATSPDSVKGIILGQDPYSSKDHNSGTAHATGVAFANPVGLGTKSPSLVKIQDSLRAHHIFLDNELMDLTSKGILCINAALTVKENSPLSHIHYWQDFMSLVLGIFSGKDIPLFAWGKKAQRYVEDNDLSFDVYPDEHPAYAARQRRDWNFTNIDTLVSLLK